MFPVQVLPFLLLRQILLKILVFFRKNGKKKLPIVSPECLNVKAAGKMIPKMYPPPLSESAVGIGGSWTRGGGGSVLFGGGRQGHGLELLDNVGGNVQRALAVGFRGAVFGSKRARGNFAFKKSLVGPTTSRGVTHP